MLSPPRSILVLFACGAVLLSTGCGGSGGSSDQLSAVAFRNKANHICRELSRQAKASSKTDIKGNFARIDAAVARLEDLNPPARYAPRYQALLTNFKQTVDFVRTNRVRLIALANRLSAHPSDKRTQRSYQELLAPFERQLHLTAIEASALGLPDCANGFTQGTT